MNNMVLLFSGQGSQYVGMGKGFYDSFSIAREVFEEGNEAVGCNIQKLCFEGPVEELTKTENTQPAILIASVALFKVYMQEIGNIPENTAGHSLGEITALCCAGAIKFSDAVKIVRNRGRFMQEAVALGVGSMAAVSGVETSVIEDVCEKVSQKDALVVVSNYNSADQIVISGHTGTVAEASEKLKNLGAKIIPLKVSAPFHSPLMQPAADRLKEELEHYTYADLKWPVISNVTAKPYPGKEKIIEYLSRQIVQPVRWQESMEYLQKQGTELAIEMGPQAVLRNLMKKNAPGINAFAYEKDQTSLKEFLATAGKTVGNIQDINGIAVLTKCIAITVCTKNSNWNEDEYQKGVVEPYRKLQALKDQSEQAGKQPTLKEMQDALEMLRMMFITKRTPVEEQVERFNQIFNETGTRHLFPDFKMPM